jgi:hypothetical protein
MVFRKDGGEGGTNYCIELAPNPLQVGVDTLDSNAPNLEARSKPREGEELDLRTQGQAVVSLPGCIKAFPCTESCICHQTQQARYSPAWQHFRTCRKTESDV